MKIFKHGGHRLFENDPETTKIVTEMLLDLEKNGMDAVIKYSKKFDNWNPDSFELTESQINKAIAEVEDQVIEDTEYCQTNIRNFAQAQLESMLPMEVEIRKGITLGHKHIPVNSVGSYIPGGTYPLFNSASMSIIPAKVAGVKEVIACTPPAKGIGYFPATINAMKKAGADRIFILGGVPALALMAFGMGVVEPVDILCGAGNKYVTEAKRQLFGRCGIDLLAGPSEILVIADDTADPALVACDLLGQAEHDPHSGIALICMSEKFAKACQDEVAKQLELLPSPAKEIATASWGNNGPIYIAEDKDEAIAICNDYAPEHLEIHVEDLAYYHDHLTCYGSLFEGEETTVAYGDKGIGTNHILPTSRAARYTGGVWVGKFLKTCTYQRATPEASHELGKIMERQCLKEKLPAHAKTCTVRIERFSKR
ncbi:MAG: histidinol dehydrogenase [Dehalobacterium sp.]